MKSRANTTVVGVVALVFAAIGTLTSLSVVMEGTTEGGVYLTVNILLAVVGVFLLFLRRRGARHADDVRQVD